MYLLHKQDPGQYLVNSQEMVDVGSSVMGTRVAGAASQDRGKVTRISNSINIIITTIADYVQRN